MNLFFTLWSLQETIVKDDGGDNDDDDDADKLFIIHLLFEHDNGRRYDDGNWFVGLFIIGEIFEFGAYFILSCITFFIVDTFDVVLLVT